MVPPLHTAAYRRWRQNLTRPTMSAFGPNPDFRTHTIVTLWETGLYDTVEIAARVGMKEESFDRIISADMGMRNDDREERR